jgi:hypothetical protein
MARSCRSWFGLAGRLGQLNAEQGAPIVWWIVRSDLAGGSAQFVASQLFCVGLRPHEAEADTKAD